MALRSIQSRSNLAEWQARVHRLWSGRRQHWDALQKERYKAPPSAPPTFYTSRSASEWRPSALSNARSIDHYILKPPHGPLNSACERKTGSSAFSSPRSQPKLPSSAFFNSARSQSKPSSPLCNSSRSQSKRTASFYKPSAWREEIVAVPLGLATQTQSQLIVGLINRGSGAFLEQLQRPHKSHPNPELLKLGPRLSGFGSSRLFPASQAALEDRIAKESSKHRVPVSTPNVAFGRSNYASYISRSNVATPRMSLSDVKPSTTEAANAGAKRDVINRIQNYHINAEARAQLVKRAESARHAKRLSSSAVGAKREGRVSVSARGLKRESLL